MTDQTSEPLTGDDALNSDATKVNIAPADKTPNITDLYATLFAQSGAAADKTVIGPGSAPAVAVPTWAWAVAGGLAAWLLISK